jgi:hypothetical protein
MTLAPPWGSPVDIDLDCGSQDPARPSKSKAMALLHALEARTFTGSIRHAASHPKPLPTRREGLMGEEMDVAMSSASEIKGIIVTNAVGNASISTCSSCSIIPLQTVKCAA